MTRLLLLLGALCLGGCDGCRAERDIPHCPPCPCLDMREPPRDLALPTDLPAPRDLAAPADLACIRCDAVLNPCPALGLDCDPVARCCAARPPDLSPAMSCQPRLGSCVAPLRCCPGLSCVGGLCAAVPADL